MIFFVPKELIVHGSKSVERAKAEFVAFGELAYGKVDPLLRKVE
jgi:hypothetical protein